MAQEALDLVAHRLDRGFDIAGDLGEVRRDRVGDGLDFGFETLLLYLQLLKLSEQRGIVPRIDDRIDDARALRLGSLQGGL
ncbi:MAG TPA: hypothetical protein VGH40_22345 [Roseiarcus sp.]